MKYHCLTDSGKVREGNEDNIFAVKFQIAKGHESNVGNYHLFIVADGMGGHTKGEVASALAIKKIVGNILNALISDEAVFSGERISISDVLKESIIAANYVIHNLSKLDAENKGMGSTVVVGLIYGDMLYVAHVGDSRAYLFKGNQLGLLTEDHSEVQEMVKAGIINEEQARHHFRRNVITRSLGARESVDVDLNKKFDNQPILLKRNDMLLLCSDGLNSEVTDNNIVQIFRDTMEKFKCAVDLETLNRTLVSEANKNGGHDNISVVTALIEDSDLPFTEGTTERTTQLEDQSLIETKELKP